MMRPIADRPRPRQERGFTIIEVLIAVAIMGMMMVAVTKILTTVRVTRDRIHNIQETQLAGPVIVDMIIRDLRGLVVTDRPQMLHIAIEDRVEYGLDADRIDFVTTTNSREAFVYDDRPLRADICEVGYVTRVRPDDDQFLELYRREDFGVDEEPFAGGSYSFLSDRVKALTIDVYAEDGPDVEPLTDWGIDLNDPETQGLPAWIEVRLQLENTPRLLREQIERSSRERATVTYVRSYRFPEALRFEDDGQVPSYGIPTRPSGDTDDGSTTTGGGNGEDGNETGGGGEGGGGGNGDPITADSNGNVTRGDS